MRSKIIIETDRARTESEKQTEVLLDIRDLLIKQEAPKKDRERYWKELEKFL